MGIGTSKIFTSVPHKKLKKNVFDLTHEKKLSTKMSKIIPIMCMDVVPGDKVSVKTNILLRFAPLIAPVMHRVNVFCHFFFVPNRILWPNWEKFITGGEDGQDATVWPHLELQQVNNVKGQLADFLGCPTADDGSSNYTMQVSALPFNGYQKIIDEYYRDENLQPSTYVPLVDGVNPNSGNTSIFRRA